jgi:hypothetical protein
MKIGKAKYGGDYVKRKYWKLKDGEAVFRILPPLGDLADDGKWSVFYNVHYGYQNSQKQMRVFQSPLVKNRKTKMIEVPDAALERIEKLKAEYEKAKRNGPPDLLERLDKLVGPKGQFNLDNNHYVNAIDTQGNIGILKLRHRAKLALDATIKRLRETGTDPLSAENGRFFVFRRSGNGLDTTFQVEILKEKITVEKVGPVEREIVHVLTDDIITRLSKEAAQLDKLFKRPTSEEVARIVSEGSRAVDEILDAKNETASDTGGYSDTDEEIGEEATSDSTTAAQAGLSTSGTLQTPQVNAQTVAVQPASVLTINNKNISPAATNTGVTSSQVKTSAQSISEMSEEEFLKSFR